MPARIVTFDELKQNLGQEIGSSDWVQITQDMIDRFAELTNDHQWIHVNPARASAESPFGSTIAHGFLTLSMITSLSHQAFKVQNNLKMTINYGLNRVRFVSPVRSGSHIRGRFVPKEVGDNQVIWLVTVEIEGSEKPALVAEWIGRFY